MTSRFQLGDHIRCNSETDPVTGHIQNVHTWDRSTRMTSLGGMLGPYAAAPNASESDTIGVIVRCSASLRWFRGAISLILHHLVLITHGSESP